MLFFGTCNTRFCPSNYVERGKYKSVHIYIFEKESGLKQRTCNRRITQVQPISTSGLRVASCVSVFCSLSLSLSLSLSECVCGGVFHRLSNQPYPYPLKQKANTDKNLT